VYQAFSWVGSSVTYPQLLLDPLLTITLSVVLGVGSQLLGETPVVVPGAVAAGGLPALGLLADQPVWAGVAQAVAAPAAMPTVSGAPASAPGSAPAVSAATAPAVPYAVGGFGSDGGVPPTLRDESGDKAPAADIPASAAVAAAASAKRRDRRRRRAPVIQRAYGDEYMDLESDVGTDPSAAGEPGISASAAAAGPLGFSGAPAKGTAEATGLRTLACDAFGDGPTSPMLPGTWDPIAGERDGAQPEAT
jgi:hypothetical protein